MLERVANASFASSSRFAFSATLSDVGCDFALGFNSTFGSDFTSDWVSVSDSAVVRFFLMKFLVSSAIFVEVSLVEVTRLIIPEIRLSTEGFDLDLLFFSVVLEVIFGLGSMSGILGSISDNNFL